MTRILLLSALLAGSAWSQDVPAPDPVEENVEEAVEEATGPRTYSLDSGQSWLFVMVFNDDDRWTPVQGHTHGIKATSFTGEVVWDPNDASACKIEISFPVTALAVDPPGMRERAKLSADGAIGDGAKKTVVGNMTGRSQLEASKFATIGYTSTACSGEGETVDVTGTLQIHGVGKEITVPMTITVDGDSFRAKGQFTLGHADFGMKPFTYGPATPKNQEKLEFYVDVVGAAK